LAASINAGVIAVAGGAAARSGDANIADAAIEAEAFRTSRRDSLLLRITTPPCVVDFLFRCSSEHILDHLGHVPFGQIG
jgi:hypothetical protein